MLVLLAGLSYIAAGAEVKSVKQVNNTTSVTTTTTTIISKTIIKQEEKIKWSPFKVCVLDFSSIDIQGQRHFLNEKNQPINIPPQCTLNNEDRKSINSVMQGFVRMIDAWDNSQTNNTNRSAQVDDNAFNRAKALALYDSIANGVSRPMIIGAEYLAAYLGKRNDVFSCVDTPHTVAVMEKLRQAPDFPKDFMLRLAKETGVTHLIYGTVSDIRTRTNAFRGYGIETKTTNFQLDVIIKLVDLAAQRTVYSNVYTGNYREQRPISGAQFDNNIFQNLMTSALEQAAEDLYDQCRPGRKNRIKVTPLPYNLTVIPAGNMFFKPENAATFIDGQYAGNGNVSVLVPAGNHTVEVKAAGYKNSKFEVNITGDKVINAKLNK